MTGGNRRHHFKPPLMVGERVRCVYGVAYEVGEVYEVTEAWDDSRGRISVDGTVVVDSLFERVEEVPFDEEVYY